jgi:hypothetical protein
MLLSGQPAGATFLEGELREGTTYYAEVTPRSGWTPFRLAPLDPARDATRIATFLQQGTVLQVDDGARQWDHDNHSSAMEKRQEGLRKTPEAERAHLEAHHGVVLSTTDARAVVFSSAGAAATPPVTGEAKTTTTSERLRELESLRSQGLLTDEEYREKRQAIIDQF